MTNDQNTSLLWIIFGHWDVGELIITLQTFADNIPSNFCYNRDICGLSAAMKKRTRRKGILPGVLW